jgi:hypothetical protein
MMAVKSKKIEEDGPCGELTLQRLADDLFAIWQLQGSLSSIVLTREQAIRLMEVLNMALKW